MAAGLLAAGPAIYAAGFGEQIARSMVQGTAAPASGAVTPGSPVLHMNGEPSFARGLPSNGAPAADRTLRSRAMDVAEPATALLLAVGGR